MSNTPASFDLKQDLALKLDLALMELRNIDEALARRPALADLPDRYSKVYRACEMAGRAEAAEKKLAELQMGLTPSNSAKETT